MTKFYTILLSDILIFNICKNEKQKSWKCVGWVIFLSSLVLHG